MHTPEFHELLQIAAAKYIPVEHFPGGLPDALNAFGLFPETSALQELSAAEAADVLAQLLWKGMAYGDERCEEPHAKTLAEQFVSNYEASGTRFLSNGNWAQQKGWYPLTRATFDSGLIIELPANRFACVWFEDED